MARPPKPAVKPAAMPAQPPQPAAPAPVWLKYLVAALTALLLLTWFSKEVADSDTWWHLKTGQYIVQTHKLPVPDPFAFTTAITKPAYPGEDVVQRFNLTHEWLAQIVFYLVYAAGGFPLLVLFRCAMLILVSAIVGWIAYQRTGGYYRAIVAAVAVGSIGLAYLSDRPFLFSFVFLAAIIAILDQTVGQTSKSVNRPGGPANLLWLLPPIFLIWANCHGGYFIGYTALAAYCAQALYNRYRGNPHPNDRALYLASAASVLISGLNPNGFNAIRVALLYRQSVVQTRLLEWQHTNPFELEPFQVLLVLTFAVLLWQARRVRLSDWLFFLGYAALALWAVRNVMLFGIVAPLILVTYFPWTKLRPAAEYAAATALALLTVYQLMGGHAFELRASTWKYPWGAAKFLEEHHISNRLFNSYPNGGFLIWRLWPLEKVFIDGRAMGDEVFKDFYRIAYNVVDDPGHSARELLNQYGVETVLLEGFEYNSGEPYMSVAAMSDPNQQDWTLVFQDETGAVFMRHPPPDIPPLRLAYPLAGMELECRNYIEHDPTRVRCARGLGLLFLRLQDVGHARQWLAWYLDHAPADPESQQAYARILAGGR